MNAAAPVHRCAAARGCRNTQHVDDPETGKTIRLGAQIDKPSGLCDACTKAVAHAIEDMTETWLVLHMAIGDRTSRADQKVSVTRSAPINLNADVDALKVDIVEWLTAAAARVAEQLNTGDPQPANNTDLEHAKTVVACVRLLTPNVDKLLALPADTITIWLTHGETERPGEYWKDAWGIYHGRREIDMTGIDLALKLVGLRNKSRKLLGLNNPSDALALPCPGCNQVTLKRRHFLQYSSGPTKLDGAEVDRIDCTNCGWDQPYERYQHLVEIWLEDDEMERDNLQKQVQQQQRELEILRWLLAERENQFKLALACTDIPASVFAQEVLSFTLDVDSYMSDKDLAPLAKVSESTIRSWASKGLIARHVADDGAMVFSYNEVMQHAETVGRRTHATA